MSDPIHDAVQKHYAAIAANASCCEPADCDCGPQLYDITTLDDIPAEVANLSLGCGDPVTIASLNPGETVLDLGSGAGLDCFLAARQVGPTGRVIGVDMTPEMLSKANANRDQLGVDNVEFRKGSIEAMPVKDGSIDVVMSNCVINLSPDKAAVFQEAFRVLRPGGRLAISDIVTDGEFSEQVRQRTDLWAACVSGAIDVQAYTGLMAEAGFVDIQVQDKAEVGQGIPPVKGRPRVFSARITAIKPG